MREGEAVTGGEYDDQEVGMHIVGSQVIAAT